MGGGSEKKSYEKLFALKVRRCKQRVLAVTLYFCRVITTKRILALFVLFGLFSFVAFSRFKRTDFFGREVVVPATSARSSNLGTKFLKRGGIHNLKLLNYPIRPRTLGYYFKDTTTTATGHDDSFIGHEVLPLDLRRRPDVKYIDVPPGFSKRQQYLKNEMLYDEYRADPLEEGDCTVQHDWQGITFPTCNAIHELDLGDFETEPSSGTENRNRSSSLRIIDDEMYRDVWIVPSLRERTEKVESIAVADDRSIDIDRRITNTNTNTNKIILKTLRIQNPFTERHLDRFRRDAIALERLTRSRSAVDIYGHCAMSRLSESFLRGQNTKAETIYDRFHSNGRKGITSLDMLNAALDVVTAVDDVHNSEGEEGPVIVHSDITPEMFVQVRDEYVMDNFGRCRFLNRNKTTGKLCGFFVDNNSGIFRSPEEYKYMEEDEKIDVYSMGNVLYLILTGWDVFEQESTNTQRDISRVRIGKRSAIPVELKNSSDEIIKVIVKAIQMCWKQDPVERPSAREIKALLSDKDYLKNS